MRAMIRVYKISLRKNGASRHEFFGTKHEAEARLRSWLSSNAMDHKGDLEVIEAPADKDRVLALLNQHATGGA
jgi:hypothetical protein